jgi:hypothetical protein
MNVPFPLFKKHRVIDAFLDPGRFCADEKTAAKCQSDLNILLSERLLQYACRRPSMLGDLSVDTYNNTSIVQHCEGPWNPSIGRQTPVEVQPAAQGDAFRRQGVIARPASRL